ncbi:MAG: O-methyltransferase [Nitrospirota bacterium]
MTPSKHTENRNDYQTPALLDYIKNAFAPEDSRHHYLLSQMEANNLPQIQIGATEGKILQCLVHGCHAERAVEIGTLGGYSALWIADGMPPDGKLYTLENDPDYALWAAAVFVEIGISEKISVLAGDANKTLETLTPFGPFDFCFIDADKISYPNYLLWAAQNLRPGGVVALDNAYLFGNVHKNAKTAAEEAPAILAMQKIIGILNDRSFFSSAMMIPTGEGMAVGVK